MIIFIVFPAGFFLVYNNPRLDNLEVVLSQIGLLFVFDFAIRFESNMNSKPTKTLVTVAAFTSLAFLVAVQTEVKLNVTLLIVIVLIGYSILRQNIGKSLRSVLLLVHLGLCVFLIGAAIWANPFRALLMPYLIYVALHETFLGDNRNPSKLIFGAVCLSI